MTDKSTELKFSILIPTWNNLDFLKLCVNSILKNSSYRHQIIIYVNDGSDGTLEWVKSNGFDHMHSLQNVGICFALNSLRSLVKTDYICYMNDDMYVCPLWDKFLWDEIQSLKDKYFFLSSTSIQPHPFYDKRIIAPANYGESVDDFREDRLLKEYASLPHCDWFGSTWPPNVVHKDIWDLAGGYSIEFSPGMYSDPDFAAKLWLAGVRYFKGVSKSLVYHFEARSTSRIKKNNGSAQFLMKYGITSSTFVKHILKRGEPFSVSEIGTVNKGGGLYANIARSKLKRLLYVYKDLMAKKLWEA